MTRLLSRAASATGLRVAELSGGTLRNAIPREAEAMVVVAQKDVAALNATIDELGAVFHAELGGIEPDLKLQISEEALPAQVMDLPTQQKLLMALSGCPNGVIRMSREIEGVVESSTNLGVIRSENGQVYIQCLIRSLIDSGRDYVEQMTRSIFELAGARCEFTGAYPGWAPNNDSAIMQTVRDCHEELFGTRPNIMVIHAGLECGLFKNAYPNWDMVSFGPTIRGAHSPDERVHIESVGRFWTLLLKVLEQIPVK